MYINTYTSYMHYMHIYIYTIYAHNIQIWYMYTHTYIVIVYIYDSIPFWSSYVTLPCHVFFWYPSAPRHAWRNLSFIGFLGQHPSIGSDSGGGDEDNEDFGSWWVKSTDMSCKCHANVMYSENTQIHEMLNKRCGNMCLYWDYSMAM